MKYGTVAIVGRSNVGKSTLLNRLLREKVAIVSEKPQTTRTRILGVAHLPAAQIAFLDTPGFHRPQHLLNRRMIRTASETFDDADLIYLVLEASGLPGPSDRVAIEQVLDALARHPRPVLLVINKSDLVKKHRLLPLIETYGKYGKWAAIVPVSARTGDNVDRLLDVTVAFLEEGEAVYDDELVTDQTLRALAAELIREQVLRDTYEEVPHAVAVDIDEFIEAGNLARISACVLVEKDSQKAIVIGKHGGRLKSIGTAARREMERRFGMKVFLQLWVKVREAWREDERVLVELGY